MDQRNSNKFLSCFPTPNLRAVRGRRAYTSCSLPLTRAVQIDKQKKERLVEKGDNVERDTEPHTEFQAPHNVSKHDVPSQGSMFHVILRHRTNSQKCKATESEYGFPRNFSERNPKSNQTADPFKLCSVCHTTQTVAAGKKLRIQTSVFSNNVLIIKIMMSFDKSSLQLTEDWPSSIFQRTSDSY